MTPSDLSAVAPELFLSIAGMVLLLVGAFFGNRATNVITFVAVGAFLIAALQIATGAVYWQNTFSFTNMFQTGAFSALLKVVVLMGLSLALALSSSSLRIDLARRFEYPVLMVFAGLGMLLMLSASDFLVAYVGLELSSLSLYILAAFRRDSLQSAEAGLKYFILGALSSGMLLFGISLIYGFAGTTNFAGIASVMEGASPMAAKGLVVGMAFVIAGIAFKISAVPFHMWTPDVYQGAPTPVTALFAMVPKIAALGLLIRTLFEPFGALQHDWVQIIAFLSVASMLWASFAAIAQTSLKRLLAYSSIGNIGYALIGVIAGTPAGVAATVLYMTIYLAMTAGAFAVVIAVRRKGASVDTMADFAGLSRTHPALAWALAIFLFSMSGIPPLAGFFGKLMIFQAAVAQGFYALAIVGVLASVVAAYYYLKVIRIMFFDKESETLEAVMDWPQKAVLALSLVFILGFILAPQMLSVLSLDAAKSLFPG